MESYYDEVEIEDMEFDEDNLSFHSPCPCGDRFEISLTQLQEGEDIARCPSCSLIIRVIYDPVYNPGDEVLIWKDDFAEDAKMETIDVNKSLPVKVCA